MSNKSITVFVKEPQSFCSNSTIKSLTTNGNINFTVNLYFTY